MARCKLQIFLFISILAISLDLNASPDFDDPLDFVMRRDALNITAATKHRSPYYFNANRPPHENIKYSFYQNTDKFRQIYLQALRKDPA